MDALGNVTLLLLDCYFMNRGESKGSNPPLVLGFGGVLLYGFFHVFTAITTRFYLLVDLRNEEWLSDNP